MFVLFFLVGCNNFRKIEPVTRGIEFVADIKYYNEHYECECDIDSSGEMNLKFTYPAEIEGLEFNLSKNGISAEYRELEYINKNEVFKSTVACLLWEVFLGVGDEVKSENDVFYALGETKEFDYRLELGSSGLPIKLKTNPDIAEIEFRNVRIK